VCVCVCAIHPYDSLHIFHVVVPLSQEICFYLCVSICVCLFVCVYLCVKLFSSALVFLLTKTFGGKQGSVDDVVGTRFQLHVARAQRRNESRHRGTLSGVIAHTVPHSVHVNTGVFEDSNHM
jgi:hypothetical protein